MRYLLALLFCGLLVPASRAEEPGVDWQLVTPQAAWRARDSQGEVTFAGRMWIFGGWFDSFEAPPRDVWSSADGQTWEQVTPAAPWLHSDLSMALSFERRMWFMGGWYNGRLPGHSASNGVWSSTDGRQWQQVTAAAGWSPRLAAALVEFQGKMWLLGGTENYYFGDRQSLKNDVWFSTDGKHWEQATASAPWAPRAYHQAAVLNDRLYVFGGGNYVPEYEAFNDVWSTSDGVHWKQETDAAGWSPRLWFPAAVYRDRIWILGGWSNNPSTNHNDVWHSANGRDWEQLSTPSIWKPRHEHSAFVHNDHLWIAGGHAQPLSNEVWKLKLPAAWGK